MLDAIELRDFAIVDELRLELGPGLNVLTGETGAGKSILVDALSLLVGERADAAAIRARRDSALVQGFFDAGSGGGEGSGEGSGEGAGGGDGASGGEAGGGAGAESAVGAPVATAGRRIVRDGRNTARIDGEVVTVAELADRVGARVAIFAQHAAQRLLSPDEQRVQLDRLLDDDGRAALARYRVAFGDLREVEAKLEELATAARDRERQLDLLRFQRDEIDDARLEPGEDDRLGAEAESLRHHERIVQGVGRALAALAEGEPSALELLAEARRGLDDAGRHSRDAATLAEELREAMASVEAVQAEAEGFVSGLELDPARLDAVEARLARLDRLARKYGDGIDAILAFRERVAAEIASLENADASRETLERRRAALRAEIDEVGAALAAHRRAAARQLETGLEPLLARLDMPDARFAVELEPAAEPTAHGLERVRFAFSANPGEPLGPLARVVSGGELSRLMLALHVIGGSDASTLVFDEVDAGIGGRAARAVGELLQQLGRGHQVLVVTHLPQVAAFGDRHVHVYKREAQGRTVTRVRPLDADERVDELARMLSGLPSEAARRNAHELLEAAARRRAAASA